MFKLCYDVSDQAIAIMNRFDIRIAIFSSFFSRLKYHLSKILGDLLNEWTTILLQKAWFLFTSHDNCILNCFEDLFVLQICRVILLILLQHFHSSSFCVKNKKSFAKHIFYLLMAKNYKVRINIGCILWVIVISSKHGNLMRYLFSTKFNNIFLA